MLDVFTLIPASGSAKQQGIEQQNKVPIIANLPHSGLHVPSAIAEQFTAQHLRTLPNSDWHLQPLYSFLPSLGVTVLQANYSRYVVDLNRALKPPLFGSFWSAAVPEQTAFKQPIYKAGCLPSEAQVRDRIETYYAPYHQKLATLLNEAIAQHGKVYLLDLHSFMGLITDDVCLGNAKGTTCSSSLIDAAAESFAMGGYGVVQNKVFTGGYITRHYGHQPNVEALQIEIRYPIYLPPDQLSPDQLSPDQISSNQTSAQIGTASTSGKAASDSTAAPAPLPIPNYQSPVFDQAQTTLRTVFSHLISSLS